MKPTKHDSGGVVFVSVNCSVLRLMRKSMAAGWATQGGRREGM
jgi:hypothetical protein